MTEKSSKIRQAFVGGVLIDGTGRPPVKNATVLVENDRIVSVEGGNSNLPPDYLVMDIRGKTIMPGMIDCHVHLRSGPSDKVRLGAGDVPSHLDMSLPTITLKGLARARRSLEMGVTMLRDVGDVGNIAVCLRDAIDAGIVVGPRILASGPNLTTTGGTADYFPDWLIRTDIETRVADGVEWVRKAVRRNIKNKTDWIKFFATGTFGDGGDQDFTDAEMSVMVEEAHNKGKYVCAHACFEKGTLAAVKAGVDTIEHGSRLDDRIIEAMLERGTALVPTIYIFEAIVTTGEASKMRDSAISAAKRTLDRHVESFRKAWRAGVPIAMGSDCGNAVTEHGTNARELELMVRYGMSEMDAIVAATLGAATALRLQEQTGSIEVGKSADIVVVNGDPLTDISVLKDQRNIELVMKDGAIIRSPSNTMAEAPYGVA